MSGIGINNIINKTTVQSGGNDTVDIKTKIERAADKEDDTELLKACQEFESVFMDIVFKEMQSTVKDGGAVEKSYARDVYEGMLSEELTKEMTEDSNSIGLAKMIYENMKKR